MLCANFETDPIRYRSWDELPVTSFFPGIRYHDEIFGTSSHTIGAQAEVLDIVLGLYASAEGGRFPTSGSVNVIAQTKISSYPGWQRWVFHFDAETGEHLGASAFPIGFMDLTGGEVRQSAAGGLWTLASLPERLLPITVDGSGDESRAILAADFGYWTFGPYLIDELNDLLLVALGHTLDVWQLSTQTRLAQLSLPEPLLDLCAEQNGRAYGLTASHSVLILDYRARRWLGALRIGTAAFAFVAWDKRYRRLITTPQASGSGLTRNVQTTGYRMLGVPTHLCPPIPLDPPRAGRQGRVLFKATGDRGEGVPGTVYASGDLGPRLVPLDSYGEGIALYTPATAGPATVNLVLDTPCLA